MKSFDYIQDPGHGWLAVSLTDLARVHLSPQDFSGYSYMRRGVAYLEEDCDMPKFLEHYRRLHAFLPEIVHRYVERTPIRGYASLNPQR